MVDGPESLVRRPPVARAAAATFATNVAVGVLSLGNVLITSRVLGPAGRGQAVFLITTSILAATLASLGISEAIANLAAVQPETRPALATNSVLLSVLFGGAAVLIVDGILRVLPSSMGDVEGTLRWITLAAIPLQLLNFCLVALARADYGFKVANLAWLAGPITSVVVNATLAALGHLSVASIVAAWVAGLLLGTGLLVQHIVRRLAGFGRPDPRLAGACVSFGLKSHLGGVMFLANLRLDHWLVGVLAGSRQLGLYNVAVAWTEALFFLPTSFAYVLRPDLVRAAAAEASRQASRAFRLSVLITLPLVVALILAAPLLCAGMFGEQFRGSIIDLRILSAGAFGILALKLLGHTLTAQGRPFLETVALGAALASAVGLDLALIPALGGVGAAIGSTVSYTLGGIVVARVFLRTLGGRPADLVPRSGDARDGWRGIVALDFRLLR